MKKTTIIAAAARQRPTSLSSRAVKSRSAMVPPIYCNDTVEGRGKNTTVPEYTPRGIGGRDRSCAVNLPPFQPLQRYKRCGTRTFAIAAGRQRTSAIP
jgi:hypothetical protein